MRNNKLQEMLDIPTETKSVVVEIEPGVYRTVSGVVYERHHIVLKLYRHQLSKKHL